VASLLHRTLPWRVPGLEPLRLRPTLTPGRMRATAVVAHSSISMREAVLATSDLEARAVLADSANFPYLLDTPL